MRLVMTKGEGSITPDELGSMWFEGKTLFTCWNSERDLAQATWEWSKKRSAFARVADREAEAWDHDWEQRGRKEFSRQLYGN